MSDVVMAAVVGGAVGSFATIIGVWIDHRLLARRVRKRHQSEVLERMAQLLDEVANGLINMVNRLSDEKDMDGTPVFRLRSLAALYLPDASAEAQEVCNTWIAMFKELNDYRADRKYGRRGVPGPHGASHDEIMRRWKKKITHLLSNVESFENKLHERISSSQE